MARRVIISSYRSIMAVLVITAIAVQLVHTLRATPPGSAVNFFSYFTIESNLIAAAVFIIGAIPGRYQRARWYDYVRGAATTYMSVTGAVYATLLSDLPAAADSTIPWVNEVLHYLMPLAVFLDWLFVPPRRRIKVRLAVAWAAYPVAYVAYVLVRGSVVNWYPYPFLNVDMHGYRGVFLNCLGIAIGAALAVSAIVWLGNALHGGLVSPDAPVGANRGSTDGDLGQDATTPDSPEGSSDAEPTPAQRAMNEATVIMPLIATADGSSQSDATP